MVPWQLHAQQLPVQESSTKDQKRLALAKLFVSKMKFSQEKLDNYYIDSKVVSAKSNVLLDGEVLLLQPVLDGGIKLDGIVYGKVSDGRILLSLRDIGDVLQLPWNIDMDNQVVKGWYINENKTFFMDIKSGVVRTDIGEFAISEYVTMDGEDILVPASEIGKWLDFKFDAIISAQDLRISSSDILPIQAYMKRREANLLGNKVPEPSLPRIDDNYKVIGAPVIDIATRSDYRKQGSGEKGDDSHRVTVRSVGDFAQGTLSTQVQLNDKEYLKNVRIKYKQDSVDGKLLGKLKARQFEVGDITTTNVPLGGETSQELGVRITNTDSQRTFSAPITEISGTGFPGWDVELYRDSQLLGFKEIGDDGFYKFSEVSLFQSNNNFRLVFYGPQGEVREESLYVPVDRTLLSRGEGIYDVSASLSGKNTYNKSSSNLNSNENTDINISARYEYPVADGVTFSAGGRSHVDQGNRDSALNVGASVIAGQALFNLGAAVDDEGDMSAQLVVRRDFGEHEVSGSLDWSGSNFDVQGNSDNEVGFIRNNVNFNGPLPFKIGLRPRYNLSSNYLLDTNDDHSLKTSVGFSTSWNQISLNEQLNHLTSTTDTQDTIDSITSIAGTYGNHRVRLLSNYQVTPDRELKNILASYRKNFNKKLNMELKVDKRFETSLTEYSAKLDWQAGFMRISPRVTYNTKKDFFAGLDTRFSLLRDPTLGRIKSYDHTLTSSGGVSAFVFLDKDGDGVFGDGDEPLEGVSVKAPQNGGRQLTDENGIALFTRMGKLRLTDIYIDEDSMQDPTWVAGFDGVSVLPREGHIVEVNFPLHISGELDGSVFTRAVQLPADSSSVTEKTKYSKPVSLKNVSLQLYNEKGEIEGSALTDVTGFYYFPRIPPGRYLLLINEKSAKRGKFVRPSPQQIEIGYDGTIIYGNDVYVDAGDGDIPSEFMANLDDYKARHPHVKFAKDEYDLVFNLGDYNSRLLMSVIWYKLRSRYEAMLTGGDVFVLPEQSYADVKTGKHTLRVGLSGVTMDQAYNRCHALIVRGQYCKVEIYPSYIKQAQADVSALSK